jgi:hypothetical protein
MVFELVEELHGIHFDGKNGSEVADTFGGTFDEDGGAVMFSDGSVVLKGETVYSISGERKTMATDKFKTYYKEVK